MTLTLFFSDDDEVAFVAYSHLLEAESSTRRRRSDAPPKVVRPRDLPSGHRRIKADYFGENPVYNDKQFCRRFKMHRPLFKRIKQAVKNHDYYFKNRFDAYGKEGLSALQKCVAAIRILAYGHPADAVDEYVRIGFAATLSMFHNAWLEWSLRSTLTFHVDDGQEDEE